LSTLIFFGTSFAQEEEQGQADASDRYATLDWNGKSGQRWVVSMQGYINAVKPDGAPDWLLRLSVTMAIPLDKN